MKKLRIYVDTSVIGGCYDPEFKVWSDALIEDFRGRRYRAEPQGTGRVTGTGRTTPGKRLCTFVPYVKAAFRLALSGSSTYLRS